MEPSAAERADSEKHIGGKILLSNAEREREEKKSTVGPVFFPPLPSLLPPLLYLFFLL